MIVACGLAGALTFGGAVAAQACKGPTTLFSDDFREVDESWGVEGDSVSVDEGRVVIRTYRRSAEMTACTDSEVPSLSTTMTGW